jgi:hypothetical protein
MKIAPYVEKLNGSDEYKNFSKEHKDAFMVAGFFVLDYETNKNIHQIDYYVPSKKKIAAFNLDEKVSFQMLSLMNTKVPEKLDMKTNVDLDQLYGILEDEMKNRNITADIKKIIAILQNIDGKKIWNLSCVLSGMGLLNAHVEDSSRMVLKMEKKSLMDIIKRVNPADLQMPKDGDNNDKKAKPSKKDIETQIKKLDDLEKAIEKEKEYLKKEENKVVKSKVSKSSKKK